MQFLCNYMKFLLECWLCCPLLVGDYVMRHTPVSSIITWVRAANHASFTRPSHNHHFILGRGRFSRHSVYMKYSQKYLTAFICKGVVWMHRVVYYQSLANRICCKCTFLYKLWSGFSLTLEGLLHIIGITVNIPNSCSSSTFNYVRIELYTINYNYYSTQKAWQIVWNPLLPCITVLEQCTEKLAALNTSLLNHVAVY